MKNISIILLLLLCYLTISISGLPSRPLRARSSLCIAVSGATPGLPCVFPFKSRGLTFNGCTTMGGYAVPWCATKVDAEGNIVLGNWGDCSTTDPNCHPSQQKSGELDLTVLHVNDIHVHFEEVTKDIGRCRSKDAQEGKCFGGASRMFTKIQDISQSAENVMVLNAGDYYSGTIWYTMFKHKVVSEFANIMNYTAMGIGNHDFDGKISGLVPFLDDINFPVLAANMDTSREPSMTGKYFKSVVVDYDGVKVGIIGYVTPATKTISNPGNVTFQAEIPAVASEARRLWNSGVRIIVATGHSGYKLDREMALAIPELDLVVGGHSHSYLYTGDHPTDKVAGPYPTYVQQPGGRTVPVVQAYWGGKYLGHLRLRFDKEGELKQPLDGTGVDFAKVELLDNSVKKDEWVEELMQPWREKLTPYTTVIGDTNVDLKKNEGRESNMGNVVTDSMVEGWGDDVHAGIINNGGIRGAISTGDITMEDVLGVVAFNNSVDRIKVSGTDVKRSLEATVDEFCPDQSCEQPRFLVMSGIRVLYKIGSSNVGHRIERITIRCTKKLDASFCPSDGTYLPLEDSRDYWIAIPSFLANGGNGEKNLFAVTKKEQEKGPPDYDLMKSYIEKHTPLQNQVEGRILFIWDQSPTL